MPSKYLAWVLYPLHHFAQTLDVQTYVVMRKCPLGPFFGGYLSTALCLSAIRVPLNSDYFADWGSGELPTAEKLLPRSSSKRRQPLTGKESDPRTKAACSEESELKSSGGRSACRSRYCSPGAADVCVCALIKQAGAEGGKARVSETECGGCPKKNTPE